MGRVLFVPGRVLLVSVKERLLHFNYGNGRGVFLPWGVDVAGVLRREFMALMVLLWCRWCRHGAVIVGAWSLFLSRLGVSSCLYGQGRALVVCVK